MPRVCCEPGRNPDVRVGYEGEIFDGGNAPLFRLTAEDDRDSPLTGRLACVLHPNR